jgi:multidrug efflux pump subunit AcrA (membrane-fusion protein)
MKKVIIISIGLIIVLGIGLSTLPKLFKGKESKGVKEKMVEVKRGDIKVSISERGILEPAVKVNIISHLGGVVRDIWVKKVTLSKKVHL